MTFALPLPDLREDREDSAPEYPAEPLSVTLDRITEYNRTYVHHRHDSTHDLIALWVAHTHAMMTWDSTPRLYITAPQEGVGKSTQAEVSMLLCPPDAIRTASTSGPGLWRYIDAVSPTLFIDEAENTFNASGGNDKDNITAVVNDGYKPGSKVLRGEKNGVRLFNIYAAVAIVGIDNGQLPPTTRSRCIPVRMTPGPSVPDTFRERKHVEFGNEIRWHLSTGAMDWVLHEADKGMGRTGQLWEPLFSIAYAAGNGWVERAQQAFDDHQWTESATPAARTLEGVLAYFQSTTQNTVTSTALARHLSDDDELPTISPKALAKVMKGYDVKPHKMNGGYMTYRREELETVFKVWIKGY